jgi:putative ABC transport system permease protein
VTRTSASPEEVGAPEAAAGAPQPVVELRGVSRSYGSLEVLHPVDLIVAPGELAAVVGPSGSGKTTLLQHIGTLDRPTTGQVLIEGRDTSRMSDKELSALRAHAIGFVFQQFFLHPTMSALDNVAMGMLYTGLPQGERQVHARAALDRVGLGHRLHHLPAELSGGERQRTAVARAVVGRPPLVLADEPTGNLDSRSGADVLAVLRELHADGTTVLVITHDGEVAAAMDRRISLRDGTVTSDERAAPGRADGGRLMTGTSHRSEPRPAGPTGPSPRGRRSGGARLNSRLRPRDLARLGVLGLRGRPIRTLLSALGIGIGIAAVVGVFGISTSSQAGLLAQIDTLGTNLLTVSPGQSLTGEDAKLPPTAPEMVRRIPGVRAVSHTGAVPGDVYRSAAIPAVERNNLTVTAVSLDVLDTLEIPVVSGRWLNPATARFPAAVLGATAARRLGIPEVGNSPQVFLAGKWFTVVGVLGPAPLAPEVDTSVLVGLPVASARLGYDGHPTKIYERSDDEVVPAVRRLLAATANPENPEEMEVSRPSDALIAKAATRNTFTSLFLGLGAVALLVGGLGIANVMIISVLERRSEIGLRRSLGATRAHVRRQFMVESLLLSAMGGLAGTLTGVVITIGYAASRDWTAVVPPGALLAAAAASLVVGTLAGIYPAARAARLSPTEALRTG